MFCQNLQDVAPSYEVTYQLNIIKGSAVISNGRLLSVRGWHCFLGTVSFRPLKGEGSQSVQKTGELCK